MKYPVKSAIPMLILLLTAACTTGPRQENPEDWTETEVNEWFASEEWLGESQVRPHASIDKRKLAIRYHKNKKRWDAAFEFIRKGDFSLAVGDHALDGKDAFVRVGEYNSKDPGEVFFEAHQKHSDIQFLVTGEELIGRSDLEDARVKDPYNEENDIEFYQPVSDERTLRARPGTFFIFFPGEGHRPGIKVAESVPVKKMVIKVRE